jgi:hypothetical protein
MSFGYGRYFRTCPLLLLATAAWAQGGRGFLSTAFATDREDRGLLLSSDMPLLSLLLANRQAAVKERGTRQATLAAPVSEVLLEARLSREGPFEYCRIRPTLGSSLAPEELKLVWSFPMAYSESMTLDADALRGHPLYLPDGTIPPANFLNWGTLFYSRERNLAVGTTLRGAAPAPTRWAARTGPASDTQLHFWTETGSPDLASRFSPGVRRNRGSGGRSDTRKRSAARRALTGRCSRCSVRWR